MDPTLPWETLGILATRVLSGQFDRQHSCRQEESEFRYIYNLYKVEIVLVLVNKKL